MTENWKDILSGQEEVDPNKLMDYLEGRLSESEKHEVEKRIADSPFLNDAIEGLEQLKDKAKIARVLQELNAQLARKTRKRALAHRERKLPDQTLVIITTVAILVLVILAYIVFRMYTSAP